MWRRENRKFSYVKDIFSKTAAKKKQISLPIRSTEKSAGYDFFSPIDIIIEPGESHIVWTDIKAKFHEDECLKIYPRSSMAIKKNIILKNSVGIIDSDYYENSENDGNIGIVLWNVGKESQAIKIGDKIAQGIFESYFIINEEDSRRERNGGFGSTGL